MESKGLTLQRLHDGELPPDQAEALRRELLDEDLERLLALTEIDQLVHHALLADTEQVDLWRGLEARLPKQVDPPMQETMPQPMRQTTQETARKSAPAGRARITPLRRRTMIQGSAALMTALAMAAAFAIWFRPVPQIGPQTNHCDVETLEVAGGSATVLKVPGESGDATTVVWMDHEESDEWESL